MRVVVTVHDFGVGGTQTYALTVAEQLQRLGHDAVLHADELGPTVETARGRGLVVAESEGDLPGEIDVVLSQDAMMAYRMADRYPRAPQLFRCPSDLFDLQQPPQLPDVVSVLYALSDRFADRVRALAGTREVLRLRQPIDHDRFAAGGPLRPRPRRAALLGTYLQGARLELLRDVWGEAGVECVRVSGNPRPEEVLADADVVVAKGKAALEGMACARAVYVYDQFGCDGWVTPDSYPAIEADNFAGQATDVTVSVESLRRALDEYDPAMGIANRDVVARHHSARKHAQRLVEIMRELAPRPARPELPLRELARLVRVQWATESRAYQLGLENAALQGRVQQLERAYEQETLEREAAEARVGALKATRRYRAAGALAAAADRLRGRR